MKSKKQEFNRYLETQFKGLVLRKPLFFNWNVSLRFDLQDGQIGSDEYFAEVIKRATALFTAAFDPTDEVFVVLRDYKWRRRKIRLSSYCFNQLNSVKRADVHFSVARNLYENDNSDIYNVAILKLTADKINYKNILTAIANTDFPPRLPRYKLMGNVEIYFINTTKNLIFHMYDDRGLDILSSEVKTLRPIYTKFNQWILQVNKEKMDRIMLS